MTRHEYKMLARDVSLNGLQDGLGFMAVILTLAIICYVLFTYKNGYLFLISLLIFLFILFLKFS